MNIERPPLSDEGENDNDQSGKKKPRSHVSTEKKRLREKKRRSEMNIALERLADLVYEIEPTLMSGKDETIHYGSNSIFNRKDLLTLAAEILRRLHTENEQRKSMIEEIKSSRGTRDSSDDNCPSPKSFLVSVDPTKNIRRHSDSSSSLLPRPPERSEERTQLLHELYFRRAAIDKQIHILEGPGISMDDNKIQGMSGGRPGSFLR